MQQGDSECINASITVLVQSGDFMAPLGLVTLLARFSPLPPKTTSEPRIVLQPRTLDAFPITRFFVTFGRK
eukprot:2998603-Amphidinium_carterae.1